MNNADRRALLKKARTELRKTKEGYVTHPDGPHWAKADDYLDKLYKSLVDPVKPKLPAWGPILRGHRSILDYACTHYTTGVGWPAFDVVDDPGTDVIAPEKLIIYDNTSGAQGGDAFYARGESGCLYWIAHITTVPRQGAIFAKGAKLTEISRDHAIPHVHLAINATPLIGYHLISRRDYAPGAPSIRSQLTKALNT